MKNLRFLALSGASLLIAGTASAQQLDVQPRMGDPLPDLSPAEQTLFDLGKAEFEHILTDAEGLGPVFNDTSCAQCHAGPATGGSSGVFVTRFGIADYMGMGFDPLDGSGPSGLSLGGTLQQSLALVGCDEVIPVEATVTTKRTTPHIFGGGLLESVPDSQIQANVAVSGGATSPVQPVEGGPMRLGRFGWKGGVATLLTFSADASVNEMGLTNRFFGTENAPNGDLGALAVCDLVADPEDGPDGMGLDRIDHQTNFQRFLAPPPQTPKSGMTGEVLFNAVGCADCHTSTYTTSNMLPALDGKTIKPYGDFLLHDMGVTGAGGSGDGIVEANASEYEMMTRALWGLGGRDQFLHDGRATGSTFAGNIDAAIADHGGAASTARAAYQALTPSEQSAIHSFLQSLGQPEFDYDPVFAGGSKFDNDIDEFDWFFLEFDGWFAGPDAGNITPDDGGAVADIDQDGDFDMFDWAHMQRAFSG